MKIRSTIEPAFKGPVLDNKFVKAGLFIVKTNAQKLLIGKKWRKLDAETSTLCYVTNDGAFYELINNPTTEVTVEADWKAKPMGDASVLKPVGSWNIDNTSPSLQDSGAADKNGQFYFAAGAPTNTDVTISGLFGGQTTTIKNNDWIISVGSQWSVISPSDDWYSLNRPQAIIDLENGILIEHTHEIANVDGLSDALALKFDSENVADSAIDFNLVTDSKLISLAFLKQHYYRKTETYSKTEIDNKLVGIPDETYSKTEIDQKDTDNFNALQDYVDGNFDTSGEVDAKIQASETATDAKLEGKVDKSTYEAEKHFRGTYTSLSALQTAIPTGNEGDRAHVDAGVGGDPDVYVWDFEDSVWKKGGGRGTVQSVNNQLPDGNGNVTVGTDNVTEGATNKYFTEARAIASKLAGYVKSGVASAIAVTDSIITAIGKLEFKVDDHAGNISNPHGVTKAQVGLDRVDNTSDINKPVSIAQQSALDGKINVGNNTGLSGIEKRLVIVDENGQLIREDNLRYDTITKTLTAKGLNNLDTDYAFIVVDSNNEMVAAFRNDKVVEFGGNAFQWDVDDSVASGNARIRFNLGKLNAFAFSDKNDADYISFDTINEITKIRKPLEKNYSVGVEDIENQVSKLVDAIISEKTILASIPLTVSQGAVVTIEKFLAVTPTGETIAGRGVMAFGRDSSGVVTQVGASQFDSVASGTDAAFEVSANDVDKTIDISFTNDTVAGKKFTIVAVYTYVKQIFPAA